MATVNLNSSNTVFGDDEDNSGNDNVYGSSGNDVIDGGSGNDNLRGGAGNDRLIGGEGNDFLDGGIGEDVMIGGVGNDTYVVDNYRDLVVEDAGGGGDTVRSYIDNYRLTANVENLQLFGAAIGGVGNDLDNVIAGNANNNSLRGLAGNDTIGGGDGDDIISGDAGNDHIIGGSGIDTATYKFDAAGVTVDLANTGWQNTGGSGVDLLQGIESLEGSAFDDVLSGDANVNVISALAGNDRLRGRGGDDVLESGSGNDTFVFDAAAVNGSDLIRNFATGLDKLEFSAADGYGGATFTTGTAAVGSGPELVYNAAAHTLSFDADGAGAGASITIARFVNGSVASGDLIFV